MRMLAPNAAALGSSGRVPRLSGHDSVPPIGKNSHGQNGNQHGKPACLLVGTVDGCTPGI